MCLIKQGGWESAPTLSSVFQTIKRVIQSCTIREAPIKGHTTLFSPHPFFQGAAIRVVGVAPKGTGDENDDIDLVLVHFLCSCHVQHHVGLVL